MPRLMFAYFALVMGGFVYAEHNGYSALSLFNSVQKADRAANHYHK